LVYRDGVVVHTGAGTGFVDTGLSAGTTYTYRVSAYDAAGNESAPSAPLTVVTSAAGAPPQGPGSGEVRVSGGAGGYVDLRAGDRVRVEFGRVVSAGEMTVRVYSLSGALVRTLTAAGGVSRVEWDAATEDGVEVPSGIYILHVKGPSLDRRFRVAVVR
jgi:fibronectin type 3 domain-containing protein